MKAILIYDQQEEWDYYQRVFKGNYPKIELICFSSITEAQSKFPQTDDLSFSLIDIGHRSEPVKDVFHQICDRAKNRPVLLVGSKGLLTSLVPEDFYSKNFANEVIEKPINIENFRNALDAAIEWTEEQIFHENTVEVNKSNFIPMKIKNFYRFNKIPYDVFLELSPVKFVRIIFKDTVYPESLITKYVRKKVKYLYLDKSEQLGFLEKTAIEYTKLFKGKKFKEENIIRNQINACSILHEYLRTIGATVSLTELTYCMIDSISSFYKQHKDLKYILSLFSYRESDLAEKSIVCAYICEGMLQALNWDSELIKGKLDLASLLHDSILSNDDLFKINSKDDPNLEIFSAEEKEEYFNHPTKTADLAYNFTKYPETYFLIAQHHELPLSKGFPQKLNSHQLTTLSCLFIIASNFASHLYQQGISKEALSKSIKEFSDIYKEGNFKAPMNALASIFK